MLLFLSPSPCFSPSSFSSAYNERQIALAVVPSEGGEREEDNTDRPPFFAQDQHHSRSHTDLSITAPPPPWRQTTHKKVNNISSFFLSPPFFWALSCENFPVVLPDGRRRRRGLFPSPSPQQQRLRPLWRPPVRDSRH